MWLRQPVAADHVAVLRPRYMDLLVGPYPEALEIYKERSPIHSADKITVPVAILQVRVACAREQDT